MKKTFAITLGLILAALVVGGCGQQIVVPTNLALPTDLPFPGVTAAPTAVAQTSPPAQGTSQPIVPVTGGNPNGPTTIVFWGIGGVMGLLILIALIALLARPSGPPAAEGPREREVIEREIVERRDDLP